MYYLVLIETPYNPSDARVKLNFSLTNLMPKFIFLFKSQILWKYQNQQLIQ